MQKHNICSYEVTPFLKSVTSTNGPSLIFDNLPDPDELAEDKLKNLEAALERLKVMIAGLNLKITCKKPCLEKLE